MERRTDNNIDRRCEKKKEREREIRRRAGKNGVRSQSRSIRSLISSRGNRYTGLDNLLFSPFLLSS